MTHTFPPTLSSPENFRYGLMKFEGYLAFNKHVEARRLPTTTHQEKKTSENDSVAHNSMADTVSKSNIVDKIRNHAEIHVPRASRKDRRQPQIQRALQTGMLAPLFSVRKTSHGNNTSQHTNHNHNNQTMISPTISTGMKHHDDASWNGSIRTSRPRSRAIAIKPAKRQDTSDNDYPEGSSDQAARMYDDSTWAMYLRIVEYRQKHTLANVSHARAGSDIPLHRPNDDNISSSRGLHDKEESNGGVGFYDMDEGGIFCMDL